MSIMYRLCAVSLMLVSLNGAYAEDQRCADGQVMVGLKADGALICEELIDVLLKTDAKLLAEKRSALRTLMVTKDRESTLKESQEEHDKRRDKRRDERRDERRDKHSAKAEFKDLIRIRDDRDFNIHDQLFQEIDNDQMRFIRKFRMIPRYIKGEIKGFKFTAIRRSSILRLLGFKSGDVILRVNDHVINRVNHLLNTYKVLSDARKIQVDLLRRDVPVTFVFHRLNAREWTERYPDSRSADAQP